ncbi:plastoquinol--plastocyanin reductase [candidate division GN15 bacterium]|uniref:Plastoquinol--plastocyanin reductase n=1 Tax=candidate division GN15 bacterium TaxID=2072418 RepID=A0A855X4A6_9BACT|nr:MAG: plastoquinol--plastocyanin reductase [candidate division GN15 bacterium]
MGMEQNVSRRSFLGRFIAVVGTAFAASVLYPIIKYLIPPKSGEAAPSQVKLPFGRAELEADPHKSKTFRFGQHVGIIVLLPSGELRALSAECTHLDCIVQYRPDLKLLWCACHNGTYDLNGKNVSGPPPRPLERYAVNEVGNEIFVSKGTA